MPFKTMFWGHKGGKQASKRSVHFTSENQFESPQEPPDGDRILDQIRQMKLNKEAANSRNENRNHKSNHSKVHAGKTSAPSESFVPPPLNRAQTAPLPVSSDPLSSGGRRSRPVRKSLSLGGSLDGWELHGKRLRELSQLDNYINYLQHSPEDEAVCHMSNRLCCAQVLKTLYLRHERRYVSFLQHSRSLESSDQSTTDSSSATDSDSEAEKQDFPCRAARDTCVTPLHGDSDLSADDTDSSDTCRAVAQNGRRLPSALKKVDSAASETMSGFCRQQGSRVPVVPKRRGQRVSLSLTPVKVSPLKASILTTENDHTSSSSEALNVASSGSRKAKRLSLSESSRCSSDLSLPPFSSMAVYPGGYEIY